MVDDSRIEELAKRLADAVPEGLQARAQGVREDLEGSFRELLEAAVAKMDLVTREEFDAQAEVLQRTEAKLQELLDTLSDLEQRD